MQYTRNFGSLFPEKELTLRTFKDVDDTVLNLVNTIKTYQLAGNYALAKKVIDDNASVLSDYMLSSSYLNFLMEETRNIEVYAKGTSQSVFYQNEVPSASSSDSDVWIGA